MATCYYFKLIPETGPAIYIDEPIKWDSVQVIGKRDLVWHGFNYEYSDGETLLEFDCAAGKDFIETIYNRDGVDGLIILQFGRLNGVVEVLQYEGKLNLATFQRVDYRISCSVEKSGIHDPVKTRWETKVSMNATRSIDDAVITPPAPRALALHSKLLVNNFTKRTTIEGNYSWQPFVELNGHDMYFSFNTAPDGAENSNIAETPGTGLGPTNSDPIATNSYFLNLVSGGDFIFNIKLRYQYNIKLTRRGVTFDKPKIGDWTLNHYLHIVDKNDVLKIKQPFTPSYGDFVDGQFLNDSDHMTADVQLLNFPYTLAAGDKVYVYGHFNFDGFSAGWRGIEAYIKTLATDWNITGETSSPESNTKAFLIHEAVKHLLNAVTNDSTALVSKFLGRTDIGYAVTGCGALNMITNGFQVRRFDIENKPPQLSLKDAIGSMNALYSIGMGYENNKLRLEKDEYFFQDVEIMYIQTVSDYSERVATDFIYNNLEIGYLKYLDEGLRVLDEFNTKHEYISPIKRHDNKFSQLSTFIASGYALEITRREAANETPKDSTKYDDDIFVIAVKSDFTTEKNEPFDVVTGVVSPETSYNLRHSPKRMLLRWSKWLNGGFYYKGAGELIKNTFVKQNGELTTQFDSAETCNLGDPQKDLIKEKDSIRLAQFNLKNRLFIPEWISFKARLSVDEIELIRDCMTGQNLSSKNYGFIKTIMPNGNQVEGWLYEMGYNPNTEQVAITMLKKRFIDMLNPVNFNCLDYSDHTFAMFEAIPTLSALIEECTFSNFN